MSRFSIEIRMNALLGLHLVFAIVYFVRHPSLFSDGSESFLWYPFFVPLAFYGLGMQRIRQLKKTTADSNVSSSETDN